MNPLCSQTNEDGSDYTSVDTERNISAEISIKIIVTIPHPSNALLRLNCTNRQKKD